MSTFMDPMFYEGLGMPPPNFGDFNHNCMRSFHKSQRDMMRRDIMAKSSKNKRCGDLMEPMSRMIMDFNGGLIDSRRRITDSDHYFTIDGNYGDNEKPLTSDGLLRNRYDMYAFAPADKCHNRTRGLYGDSMYRDKHQDGMYSSGYMQGRSMQNHRMMGSFQGGMQTQSRYMDDPYYVNYNSGTYDTPVDMNSYYFDQEGRHRMYSRFSEGQITPGRQEGTYSARRESRSGQRRLSDSHSFQRPIDTRSNRRTSHGMLYSERNNIDFA
uniref:Reflectin_like n=1 Tax=Sepia officinalis TaxID=6610 RepID=I0JGW1_SEPOF|nr:reflectin_like [Sepia officinalis]